MLVARTRGLTRVLHQPEKYAGNPILTGDHPLEDGFACLHGSVLYDAAAGLFKAWTLTRRGIAYAESHDGIEWQKPTRNTVLHNGTETPIVYQGAHPEALGPGSWKIDGCSVMLDPEAEQDARFKMFSFQAQMDREAQNQAPGNTYGYFLATSPDGIHWTGPRTPAINRNDDPLMSDACSCMVDRRPPGHGRHVGRRCGSGAICGPVGCLALRAAASPALLVLVRLSGYCGAAVTRALSAAWRLRLGLAAAATLAWRDLSERATARIQPDPAAIGPARC